MSCYSSTRAQCLHGCFGHISQQCHCFQNGVLRRPVRVMRVMSMRQLFREAGSVSVSSLMAVELRKVSTLETSRTSYLKQKMQARIPPYGRSALNNTIPQLLLLSKSKALHASEVFFGFKSCGIWGYFAKKKLLQWLSLSNCLSFCILFDTLRPKSQPKFPYHGFVGVLHAAGTKTTMI